MGFDIIVLIMELEKRFGIAIPDRIAERMCTVGDVYLYLLERVRRKSLIRCPTSRAFYDLRRRLTLEFGVNRALVRPGVFLRDLFPTEIRESAYSELASAFDLPKLPEPEPPPRWPRLRAIGLVVNAVSVGVWLLNALLIYLHVGQPIPFFFHIWVPVWIGGCVFFLFARFVKLLQPKPAFPKVRDLVIRLASKDTDRYLNGEETEPTPAQIWTDLVAVISRYVDAPADKICPEYRWTNLPWETT
jgi:hypothetical protein